MALDVFTLFICELFVLFFLIIIMVFAWCGSQYNRVIGFQCLSLIITLVFVSLSSLRSSGQMFLPILVGNTLVMLAYGLMVLAFRAFRGVSCGYAWLSGWRSGCCSASFPRFTTRSRTAFSPVACCAFSTPAG